MAAMPYCTAFAQGTNPWNPFSNTPAKKTNTQPTPSNAPGDTPPAGQNRPRLAPMNNNTGAPTPFSPSYQSQDRAPIQPSGPVIGTQLESIERSDLAPVIATDGSKLPYELWRGLDLETVEKLLSKLEIPPRSQALHNLWKRLITSQATISANASIDQNFKALRAEALYRSGLIENNTAGLAHDDATTTPGNQTPDNTTSLDAILTARSDIVIGRQERGCKSVRRIDVNAIPSHLKSEAILLFGYCAAQANNQPATELAASLARENGLQGTPGLAALDAIALGTPVKVPTSGTISGLAFRLLEKAGLKPDLTIIKRADPALLVALANTNSDTVSLDIKLAAAEAATRINALPPTDLARIYRAASNGPSPASTAANPSDPRTRANLFTRAEDEFTPLKKTRLTRAFLDSARRIGLYMPAMQMIAPNIDTLQPAPEISWFSETAIEIALASGNPERARTWADLASRLDPRSTGNLSHWLALTDLIDNSRTTRRGDNLASVERMALNGKFGSEQLHRLATVLDALNYNVPIPLWQAASSTPQPTGGHLPETGVLTRLQDAAKNREFGRTVLLAMQTLGPNGAEGAHMIALGDAIRALKRAGLESDARQLAFEALFASWPRMANG